MNSHEFVNKLTKFRLQNLGSARLEFGSPTKYFNLGLNSHSYVSDEVGMCFVCRVFQQMDSE
jgi:hypothetical protein